MKPERPRCRIGQAAGTQTPPIWYNQGVSVCRFYKLVGLVLTALLLGSSFRPMTARAEAQMRCADASPRSAPCARAELPAGGLTEKRAYGALMSCCRSKQSGCTTMPDCPMRPHIQSTAETHRAALSGRRCLVSIHVVGAAPASIAPSRTRWLLNAPPALAPPIPASAAASIPLPVYVASWTYTPTLSPHSAPALHGLRAPPSA